MLSLVPGEACSSLWCAGLSLQWLLLLWSTGSGAPRVAVVHGLCCPPACGIFPSWGRMHVPCTGRQILNHWTTRESSSFLCTGTEFPILRMFWYILRWNKALRKDSKQGKPYGRGGLLFCQPVGHSRDPWQLR